VHFDHYFVAEPVARQVHCQGKKERIHDAGAAAEQLADPDYKRG